MLKEKFKIYRMLFSSTFLISAFTFGGGYVIVPLMKKKFVEDLKWIDDEEMLNIIAIAQSSPGPVAVNTSILLGYRIAGAIGAFVTIIGTILPPLIIISIIAGIYDWFKNNIVINAVLKGMQVGVAAVIADVALNLGGNVVKGKDLLLILLAIGAFIATFFFKINVVYIVLACGCIGAARILLQTKKEQKKESIEE